MTDPRPDLLGSLMVPMWDRFDDANRAVLRPHLRGIVDRLDTARPATVAPDTDSDPVYSRDLDALVEIRRVVETHGGTWRPDNPSLAVDNLLDAQKEKAGADRGRIAAALGVRLDDKRLVWPRSTADLVTFAGQIIQGRDQLSRFRTRVRDLLGQDYPPFASDDEIVAELRTRLAGADGCYPNAVQACANPGHTDGGQAAETADVQRAAPTRDALTRAANARLDELPGVDDAPARRVMSETITAVLGVLRGGGADGGREDETVEHKPLDERSDSPLIPTMWFSPSRATLRGSRTDGLIVERGSGTGRLYGYSAAAPGWRPFSSRALLPDDAILLVGHGDYVAVHDIRRLATAAGVSPDSEDPVGAIEAAIRAGREPEVVTGATATKLPDDSIVIECTPDGTPKSQTDTTSPWAVGFLDDEVVVQLAYAPHVRVLYRAPAPAPAPLTAGEVVEAPAELDRRATVGTIVEDADGQLGKRDDDRWSPHQAHLDFPVTVVRVGSGGGS